MLGAAGVAGGGLLGAVASGPGTALLFAIWIGAMGFLAPDFVVLVKTRARREQMRRDLPDALDVLAVSVEAGMAFDAALAKLSEHMSGPLVEQFELVLNELVVGESRASALGGWRIASTCRR